MSGVRKLLARVLPEPVKHHLYRKPASELRKMKELGIDGYFLLDRWALQMEAAAHHLPVLSFEGPALELWYLTGRRFWYQTAFCAWSLQQVAQRPIRLQVVDDGSLRDSDVAALRRLFPLVSVKGPAECERAADAHLPVARFPQLRRLRTVYPHIRKLTDVHAGSSGRKLVLDSDMLFFAPPTELLAWLDGADRAPLGMTDVMESYGYPRADLERLAGASLPSRVNVGVCGLTSDTLRWDEIEQWCAELLGAHGNSYYLEQALVAMVFARQQGRQLDAQDYIVQPSAAQVAAPVAPLHHYVAASKKLYFRDAWRAAARSGEPAAGAPRR